MMRKKRKAFSASRETLLRGMPFSEPENFFSSSQASRKGSTKLTLQHPAEAAHDSKHAD